MNAFKILLVVIIYFTSSSMLVCAEEPTNIPISLEETKPTPSPNPKPYAPSLIRINAYYNGVGITITSSVAIQAEVMIYDNLSGELYFDGATTLAPSFFCEIPDNATSVSIIIVTPNAEYHGTLYK